MTGFYEVPGWTSIVVAVTFLGGIQLIVLGVIGAYIADIHAEVKGRPLYVVGELENFPVAPELPPRAVVAAAASGRVAPRARGSNRRAPIGPWLGGTSCAPAPFQARWRGGVVEFPWRA